MYSRTLFNTLRLIEWVWMRLLIIVFLAVYVGAARIAFVGDVTLGTCYKHNQIFDSFAQNNPPEYFLSEAKPYFDSCDLAIANLETVIADPGLLPIPKRFNFLGKPEYLEILTQGGVNTVSVANNHTYDYGQEGFDQTLQNLDRYGIANYGYEKVLIKEIGGVKIALLSDNGFVYNDSLISRVSRYKDSVNHVIVSIHWGTERMYRPNPLQMRLSRDLVDAGASLVVGHHPHVLQPVEKYKGRYIVYSLANFCFGGNSNPKDKRTILLIANIDRLQVTLEKVPFRVSSVTHTNDFKPVPVYGEEALGILNMLKMPTLSITR